MAAPTKQEMLETLETAINALSSGAKSYTINGRTKTNYDIDDLKKMRDQLIRELSGRKSNTTYARFDNPS
jgi:hypothetical protein